MPIEIYPNNGRLNTPISKWEYHEDFAGYSREYPEWYNKEKAEKSIAELRKSLEGKDSSLIKKNLETLQKEIYDISAKIYKEAGPAPEKEDKKGEGKDEGKTVEAEAEVKNE